MERELDSEAPGVSAGVLTSSELRGSAPKVLGALRSRLEQRDTVLDSVKQLVVLNPGLRQCIARARRSKKSVVVNGELCGLALVVVLSAWPAEAQVQPAKFTSTDEWVSESDLPIRIGMEHKRAISTCRSLGGQVSSFKNERVTWFTCNGITFPIYNPTDADTQPMGYFSVDWALEKGRIASLSLCFVNNAPGRRSDRASFMATAFVVFIVPSMQGYFGSPHFVKPGIVGWDFGTRGQAVAVNAGQGILLQFGRSVLYRNEIAQSVREVHDAFGTGHHGQIDPDSTGPPAETSEPAFKPTPEGHTARALEELMTGPTKCDLGHLPTASPVHGHLTKERVRATMQYAVPCVSACYDASHTSNPKYGRVLVGVSVRDDGSVKSARVIESSLGAPDIEGCIVAAMWQLRFPSSDSSTSIQYPWEFQAKR